MDDVTVRCGCGRQMATEGTRGRGAFRCGCGIQIRIAASRRAVDRCVGSAPDGTPCRIVASRTEPLMLCEDHYESTGLRQYEEWRRLGPEEVALEVGKLRELAWLRMTSEAADALSPADLIQIEVQRDREASAAYASEAAALERLAERRRREREAESNGTIYFIGIGDLVKIGKTVDLSQRLIAFSYPAIAVLATETGYSLRERELHERFKRWRHSGEWFRRSPEVEQYIKSLRRRQAA